MGVIYYVACKDCGVCRDLDKLRPSRPSTRAEAISAADRLSTFRAALLVGFMAEHQGHNCTMFNDLDDQDDPAQYKSDDRDYWNAN